MYMPADFSEFLVIVSFLFPITIIIAYFVVTVAMLLNRKPGVPLTFVILSGPWFSATEYLTERGIMWRNISWGLFFVGLFYMIAHTMIQEWGGP